MEQSAAAAAAQITALVTSYSLSAIAAIVILIVGWIGAGWASRVVTRLLTRVERVDLTLRRFFASLVRYFILAFTVLAVLSQFGVQTASLIAVFGAAGLAVALALQGTLRDVAAGVMLLMFRPFKVGDYVEVGGIAGTVQSITLFVTEFATPDNVQVLAPNGQIWGSAVKNYSHHTTRRIDLAVGIAYEDDMDRAMAVMHEMIGAESRVLADPAPQVMVNELGDSSVNLLARFWVNAGDYWSVRCDTTKAVKERFDGAGISIPYPQRVVHLVRGNESEPATAQ